MGDSVGAEVVAPIIVPPGDRFTCRSCGACCRAPWGIPLEAEEIERIGALYPGLAFVDEVEAAPLERTKVLRRRPDGACVFLDDENRCRIHAEHGAAAKPSVCRRFPHFPRRVGGEVRLHLSRYCPTVRASAGEVPAGPDLDEAVREAPRGRDVAAGPVALAGGRTIPWEAYLGLERDLVVLLEDERWRLAEGLAAAALLVDRSVRADAAAPLPPEGPVEVVLDAIARRRPLRALYRYVVGTAVAAAERPRPLGRLGAMLRIVANVGHLDVPLLRASVPVRAVTRVGWPRRDRDFERPLRRLLASHARHGFVASTGEVERGTRLLVAAYGLVRWYARAAAAARGRDAVHPDDLGLGIAAVEYHFLLHRPWRRDAFENRIVRGWVRNFLYHPNFVDSMVFV